MASLCPQANAIDVTSSVTDLTCVGDVEYTKGKLVLELTSYIEKIIELLKEHLVCLDFLDPHNLDWIIHDGSSEIVVKIQPVVAEPAEHVCRCSRRAILRDRIAKAKQIAAALAAEEALAEEALLKAEQATSEIEISRQHSSKNIAGEESEKTLVELTTSDHPPTESGEASDRDEELVSAEDESGGTEDFTSGEEYVEELVSNASDTEEDTDDDNSIIEVMQGSRHVENFGEYSNDLEAAKTSDKPEEIEKIIDYEATEKIVSELADIEKQPNESYATEHELDPSRHLEEGNKEAKSDETKLETETVGETGDHAKDNVGERHAEDNVIKTEDVAGNEDRQTEEKDKDEGSTHDKHYMNINEDNEEAEVEEEEEEELDNEAVADQEQINKEQNTLTLHQDEDKLRDTGEEEEEKAEGANAVEGETTTEADEKIQKMGNETEVGFTAELASQITDSEVINTFLESLVIEELPSDQTLPENIPTEDLMFASMSAATLDGGFRPSFEKLDEHEHDDDEEEEEEEEERYQYDVFDFTDGVEIDDDITAGVSQEERLPEPTLPTASEQLAKLIVDHCYAETSGIHPYNSRSSTTSTLHFKKLCEQLRIILVDLDLNLAIHYLDRVVLAGQLYRTPAHQYKHGDIVETESRRQAKAREVLARLDKYRKVLMRVTGTLIDNLNVSHQLLQQLKCDCVLCDASIAMIICCSNRQRRAARLIQFLHELGPGSTNKFVAALRGSEQPALANIIEQELVAE